VVISPPDGDMAAYLEALARVRELPVAGIAPGHGPFIDDPAAKVDEYVTHRLAREEAIAGALSAAGEATVEQLVAAVYLDVADHLHPIARFSVWAHLRKLRDEGQAVSEAPDDVHAAWRPA
jgi:glyoxylase-like metal-dependent hydrolase (beta-lactamase superfamily II)